MSEGTLISARESREDTSDSDDDVSLIRSDNPLKEAMKGGRTNQKKHDTDTSTTRLPPVTPQKTSPTSPIVPILLRLPAFVDARNAKYQADNGAHCSMDESSSSKKLKTFETQRDDNIEIFLHFFDSTIKWRESHQHELIDFLPKLDTFASFFRKLMKDCPSLQQYRLSNVNSNTIRRAAASAVFFLCWCKQMNKCETGDDASVENASLKWISSLNSEQKATVVSDFASWYNSLPPVRISANKLVAASFVTCRVNVKEISTLATVIRGLMAYFTYIGCIESSYCRRPTDESKKIWASVKQILISIEKIRGGALETSQHPLSLHDLVCLMLKTDGVKTPSGIQAWCFSVVIADLGLRVGSVRNRWEKGFWLSKQELESNEDDDDEDCDCICGVADHEDCVCRIKLCEIQQEDNDLDIDFDALKVKDVVVWRQKSEEDDPSGSVRLRVTLSVSSTKTTGQKFFKPDLLSSSFPKILPDESCDWSPNAAIALTALLVMNGSLESKMFDKQFEPGEHELKLSNYSMAMGNRPLFRASNKYGKLENKAMRNVTTTLCNVAETLRIPSCLFTSRAYRMGYAKTIIASVVCRGDSQRIFTENDAKMCLQSSARWRSNQSELYIRSVMTNLKSHSRTDAGITAFDWQNAVFYSSPQNKSSYHHVPIDSLLEHMISMDPANEAMIREQWESLSGSQKKHIQNTINSFNWKNSEAPTISDEEMRTQLGSRAVLNVYATFAQLHDANSWDPNTLPFGGFGRGQNKAPFICPIMHCSSPSHESLESSNHHWETKHENRCEKDQFLCPSCEDAQSSNRKSFMRHLRKWHSPSPVHFQWKLA